MTVTQLVDRERAVQRRLTGAAGVLAGLAAIALLVAAGAVALGGARWITRPALPLVLWGLALGAVSAITWLTQRRVRREASRPSVAAAIEREQSLRRGQLRGALEVSESGSLGRRGAAQMATRLEGSHGLLAPAMRRTALVRSTVAFGVAAVALLLLGTARAAAPDGWRAVTHPVEAWRGTLLPRPSIVEPPEAVLRGERVRLRIAAEGRRALTLHSRTTGSAWAATPLGVSDGIADAVVGPLDADLILVAGDGRALSDTVIIRVADRPFLGNVSMRAVYPAYLGRVAEILPAGEVARLPRGTVVEIRGRASTELADVRLVWERDSIAMRVDGHAFTGRLQAERSGRWAWLVQGVHMPVTDVPPPFELEVLADSVPRVEIVAPSSDTLVAIGDQLTLNVVATDDHGLTSVVLRSWRRTYAGGDQPAVAQRLADEPATQWSGESVIDLSTRGMSPGDALHVVAVATDNSPWAQTGTSRELVIRVPSLAEQRALARSLADSAVSEAASAAAAQRALERRTADAARSRDRGGAQQGQESSSSASARDQAMSYESAEQARALTREQREITERVEQLGDAAQQLEEQLRRAGALDSALSQQLAEVRALLQQALTPELEERLRSIESALQQMSRDEARQSLAELEAQQRRLREQLERSAEMLRRAALEGSMQTLRDDARELAQQQREFADSVGRGGEPQSNQARELANRSSDLAREISNLKERLEREQAEPGAQRTRTAERQAQASAEAMRRAAEHGQQSPGQQQAGQQQAGPQQRGQQQGGQQQGGQQQSGQQQSGQQGAERQAREQSASAQQAGEAMERAAQALTDAREQQIGQWKSELTNELDRSIQEMMQLAREQRGLEQQAQQGADPQSLRADQSALQQGLEQTNERLQDAGRRSSLLSPGSQRAVDEARREVGQATQAAEGRSGQQAASAMREAGDALNQAAASLVRDRERAERAQSASGFAEMIEQLQELAQQQGALNAQASGLMQMPMGQSAQMQAAASALARQQRELAREIDEVGDLDGSGRARELAREARQIAEAMEGGRIDAQTLARQQQLFRRLLDAGRTLEQDERDDTGRREARSASGTERHTPATGEAAGRAVARFREPTWEELRGLSAEERRAVLDYFKRINARDP
ncbi:MAG TPA: hypothetical protein VMM18_12350 [Gemmatimonadaceae bacterium]|nr:hypothetical protein [Gemmatimonadaceae bacterium]